MEPVGLQGEMKATLSLGCIVAPGFVHIAPSGDILGSRLCGTCSPIRNGIKFGCSSSKASFSENFERFTEGRLSFTPGTVELLRSPGVAGGVPYVLKIGPNCKKLDFVRDEYVFVVTKFDRPIIDWKKAVAISWAIRRSRFLEKAE